VWGRILNAAGVRALLDGPLGRLVEAIVGPRAEPPPEPPRHEAYPVAFTIAIIALSAKLAKADGRVTRDEVTAFKEIFEIPADEARNVAFVFNQARRDTAGYEAYAAQIGRLFRRRPAVLEELLDALFHIARADGEVGEAELIFLATVADRFGFDDAAFERIRAAQLDPEGGDPYAVLGVPTGIDDAGLKRAYRALVRAHHPDQLVARGMPPEFVALANHKLAAINAAYERVRARRSLERAPA